MSNKIKTYADKDGNILKIGDNIVDNKGLVWKLENICGVSMVVHRIDRKPVRTIVLSKFDFSSALLYFERKRMISDCKYK